MGTVAPLLGNPSTTAAGAATPGCGIDGPLRRGLQELRAALRRSKSPGAMSPVPLAESPWAYEDARFGSAGLPSPVGWPTAGGAGGSAGAGAGAGAGVAAAAAAVSASGPRPAGPCTSASDPTGSSPGLSGLSMLGLVAAKLEHDDDEGALQACARVRVLCHAVCVWPGGSTRVRRGGGVLLVCSAAPLRLKTSSTVCATRVPVHFHPLGRPLFRQPHRTPPRLPAL